MIITMFIFINPLSQILRFLLQGGILYLYFVSGILLSITQLSRFVSTGFSLGGQLEKTHTKSLSLHIEADHNGGGNIFGAQVELVDSCIHLYLFNVQMDVNLPSKCCLTSQIKINIQKKRPIKKSNMFLSI